MDIENLIIKVNGPDDVVSDCHRAVAEILRLGLEHLNNGFTERLKLIWLKASLSEMVRFLFIAKIYIYRFVPADSEIKF